MENYFIQVSYHLYINENGGAANLVEKTTDDRPFQFISGLGFALDAFEKNVLELNEGEQFAFVINKEDAYGDYMEEHVLDLEKKIFERNGKFDSENIYPGAVLPMTNEDGNRLEGIVKELKENSVVMDFNHPLAGKDLVFKGKVLTKRLATEQEIQSLLNFTQGGCHCGGKCGGEDGGCCGGKGEDGGCCGGHGEGGGCCGGKGC